MYGQQYREQISEVIRHAAELCDCLQCFFLIHSMGGGEFNICARLDTCSILINKPAEVIEIEMSHQGILHRSNKHTCTLSARVFFP